MRGGCGGPTGTRRLMSRRQLLASCSRSRDLFPRTSAAPNSQYGAHRPGLVCFAGTPERSAQGHLQPFLLRRSEWGASKRFAIGEKRWWKSAVCCSSRCSCSLGLTLVACSEIVDGGAAQRTTNRSGEPRSDGGPTGALLFGRRPST